MNWRIKARIQQAAALLPESLSLPFYYGLQRTFGGLRKGTLSPIMHLDKAAEVASLLERCGFDLQGKTALEIGTGRTVNFPLGLWLMGADRIITVDLNPYLVGSLVMESLACFRSQYAEIMNLFHSREIIPRQDRVDFLLNFKGDLEELLRETGIEYLAPADASQISIGDGDIDVHISMDVLEHIPEVCMKNILNEAKRVVNRSGVLVHFIDPSDHFSHSDRRITAINFLEFSDEQWKEIAGNRFMYHNRLRVADFEQIFLNSGYRFIHKEKTVDHVALDALIRGFSVHSAFKDYSLEELATTYVKTVAAPV